MIKGDLMQVFQDFHTHAKFGKGLHNTFFALIPKKMGEGGFLGMLEIIAALA